MLRATFPLFFVLFLAPAVALAADAAPAKPGQRADEFRRKHAEMKAILAELANLGIKYRTADDDKRAEIQQQSKEVIARGEKIEPQLVDAAKQAYAEAPNSDKDISEFLARLVGDKVGRDDYESAAEISKLLMDGGCKNKKLPVYAGMAALAVSDYGPAERYLKQAAQNGVPLKVGNESLDNGLIPMFLSASETFQQNWDKEAKIRAKEAKANDLPRVLLKTTKGDITLELFEDQAPNTVANFLSLVQRGFYKDVAFHRVLAGFMAQGGDPKGDGTGGPGYSIACECYRDDHRTHFRGTLSMAHRGRDTGGSQFFLTFVPTVGLDGRHTAFGRVIEGMDVLAKLQRRDPNDTEAPRPDKIIEAKVLRKRSHPYKVVKLAE